MQRFAFVLGFLAAAHAFPCSSCKRRRTGVQQSLVANHARAAPEANEPVLLNAKQTQDEAVRMIMGTGRGDFVALLGYTLDREDIVAGLIEAHRRGASVHVVLDEVATVAGTTRFQRPIAERLEQAGVAVGLTTGESCDDEYIAAGRTGAAGRGFCGIMHIKALLVRDAPNGRPRFRMIHGSTNWTTASRCNLEISTLITLSQEKEQEMMQMLYGGPDAIWNRSRTLAQAAAEADQGREREPARASSWKRDAPKAYEAQSPKPLPGLTQDAARSHEEALVEHFRHTSADPIHVSSGLWQGHFAPPLSPLLYSNMVAQSQDLAQSHQRRMQSMMPFGQ